MHEEHYLAVTLVLRSWPYFDKATEGDLIYFPHNWNIIPKSSYRPGDSSQSKISNFIQHRLQLIPVVADAGLCCTYKVYFSLCLQFNVWIQARCYGSKTKYSIFRFFILSAIGKAHCISGVVIINVLG